MACELVVGQANYPQESDDINAAHKIMPTKSTARTFRLSKRCSAMRLLAFTLTLVAFITPAAAQIVTQRGGAISQAEGRSQTEGPSQGPTTDVICQEEVDATFCNVVGRPSNGGFGATSNAQGTAGSSAVPTPIPHCGDFWPAGEQCD